MTDIIRASVNNPTEADLEIRGIVGALNELPSVQTTSSCAGHDDGASAYVSFFCEQLMLEEVVCSLPFTGFRGGFEGNQPTAQWIIIEARLHGGSGNLVYVLRASGTPFWRQRELLAEIEDSLRDLVSRLHPSRRP